MDEKTFHGHLAPTVNDEQVGDGCACGRGPVRCGWYNNGTNRLNAIHQVVRFTVQTMHASKVGIYRWQ
jgi:hypothetical protein